MFCKEEGCQLKHTPEQLLLSRMSTIWYTSAYNLENWYRSVEIPGIALQMSSHSLLHSRIYPIKWYSFYNCTKILWASQAYNLHILD